MFNLRVSLLFMYHDIFEWFVFKILPKRLIYLISYQTLSLIAPSVPIISIFGEMRKRGLIEYYCVVYMASFCTVGQYENTIAPSLTVGETLERFEKELND